MERERARECEREREREKERMREREREFYYIAFEGYVFKRKFTWERGLKIIPLVGKKRHPAYFLLYIFQP